MSRDTRDKKYKSIIAKLEMAEEAIRKDLHRYEDEFEEIEEIPKNNASDESAFYNSYGTTF